MRIIDLARKSFSIHCSEGLRAKIFETKDLAAQRLGLTQRYGLDHDRAI
jgi:hypothetical protein